MAEQISIDFPLRGISDQRSFEEQPELTTRESRNVSSVDPVSNRVRGGARAGMEKVNSTALGASKIARAVSLIYDQRRVDYSNETTAAPGDLTESEFVTPSRGDTKDFDLDRQGNIYAIDGNASLVKVNPDAEEVWRFSIPVRDETHVVRAIDVDEFDNIFVAVSSGEAQDMGRIWHYKIDAQSTVREFWHHDIDGFVEQMFVKNDKLYTLQNSPATGRSYIVVYGRISTAVPVVEWSRQVPFPANGLTIKASGEIVTTHEPYTERGTDPRAKRASFIIDRDEQRWNPTMLDRYEERVWCWLRADQVTTKADQKKLETGDEIKFWRDLSGKGRHLRADPTKDSQGVLKFKPPVFRAHGQGYRPAIEFKGTDYRMISAESLESAENSTKDSQHTLLPPIKKGAFLLVIVCKPSASATNQHRLIYQANSNNSQDFALWMNRGTGDPPHSTNSGDVRLIATKISGGGLVQEVGRFDNANSVAVITVLANNNVLHSPNNFGVFRVNGVPIVKFSLVQFWTESGRTIVGCDANGDFGFNGQIYEIFVLNQYTEQGKRKVATCPQYDATNDTGTHDPVSDTEVERLEQYFAYPYGVSHLLDSGSVSAGASPVWDDGGGHSQFKHSFTTSQRIAVTDATWDQTARSMTKTGAFAAYEYHEGDRWIPSTTDGGWTVGDIQSVTAKISDDAIELADTGTLPTNNVISDGVLHGYNIDAANGPAHPDGIGTDTWSKDLLRAKPILAKWKNQQGAIQWVYNKAGTGYGVVADTVDGIYTIGPRIGAASAGDDSNAIRRFSDQGTNATVSWSKQLLNGATPVDPGYKYARLASDKYDNLWVPVHAAGASPLRSFLGYDSAGSELLAYRLTSDLKAHAARVDPKIPNYEGNPTTITRPEFVWLAHENAGNRANPTLSKVRIVKSTITAGSPRALIGVAAVGGAIKTFDTGSAVLTPTGGGAALDSTAAFVGAIAFQQKAFFVDGKNYRYYDPIKDQVFRWKSKKGGSMPKRAQLIAAWRGRIVLARDPDDPHNWHMGAKDDPFNWDLFPPDGPIATQAISGNNADAGIVPDIVNTLIPYDRERLIFGGDHSLHVMWGDPLEGGSIVLLSDITGMSFGPSWTKDQDGNLYFFGSRGGVYVMQPGQVPVKLTSESIDRRMQSVDFSTHYAELAWDVERETLWVFLCPFGGGGSAVTYWRWEKRADAWQETDHAVTQIQPTCAFILDADDPDDRSLCVGCEDAFVRRFSVDAKDDDGQRIEANVVFGPFKNRGGEVRLNGIEVSLSSEQGGAWIEGLASDESDRLGDVRWSRMLHPGRNARIFEPMKGSYLFLRIKSASAGNRWAYESGNALSTSLGRSRSLA